MSSPCLICSYIMIATAHDAFPLEATDTQLVKIGAASCKYDGTCNLQKKQFNACIFSQTYHPFSQTHLLSSLASYTSSNYSRVACLVHTAQQLWHTEGNEGTVHWLEALHTPSFHSSPGPFWHTFGPFSYICFPLHGSGETWLSYSVFCTLDFHSKGCHFFCKWCL